LIKTLVAGFAPNSATNVLVNFGEPRKGGRVGRTGRRPGNQDTREAILTAAREAFAERGIDGATVRLIAAAAGVDPALVHHYFGTKDELFLAAIQAPIDPMEIIPRALEGAPDGLGERLVRAMLSVWDSPAGGPAVAMVRSAVSNDLIAKMFRDFVVTRVLRQVVKNLDLDPAEGALRATLVASQIAGLIMFRYIIKVEPIASASQETLVALIGPTVQGYLTGPLPEVRL
jgi:AcrR family transcriptional regulator